MSKKKLENLKNKKVVFSKMRFSQTLTLNFINLKGDVSLDSQFLFIVKSFFIVLTFHSRFFHSENRFHTLIAWIFHSQKFVSIAINVKENFSNKMVKIFLYLLNF